MLKIVFNTILFCFSISLVVEAAPILEEKSLIIRGNKKIQTAEEIAADLEDRKAKAEPFNPKKIKIDVHSLGLDDVEEKQKDSTSVSTNQVNQNSGDKANDKSIDKDIAALKISKKEGESEKKVVEKKVKILEKNLDDVEKPQLQTPSSITTDTESAKNQDQKIKDSTINQQNNLVDAPANAAVTESETKKPFEQYLGSNKKQSLRKRIEREKEKNNLAQEKISKQKKQEKLKKLRDEYLIKLDEEKNIQDDAQDALDAESQDLIPHEKNLSWPQRFLQYDTPPAPLLDRYRGNENKHIPLIASTREKIDLLFNIISTGSESDPSAFHSAYQQILDPNITNEKGETILTFATMLQRYSIMTSILSKGADPDLPNSLGHTPLDIAIEMRNINACKILIDMNADINYIDGLSHTYLMRAARVGFFEAVDILVRRGADINAVDSQGNTALSIAYRYKQEMIAKYLLKNGAKNWAQKPASAPDIPLIKELENKWKMQEKQP